MKIFKRKTVIVALIALSLPLAASAKMFGTTENLMGYSTMEGHCYGHYEVKKQFFWFTTYEGIEQREVDCETGQQL